MAKTHRNFLATSKLQNLGTSLFHRSSISSWVGIKPSPRLKSQNKTKRNKNHQKKTKMYYLRQNSFTSIYYIKSKEENKQYATSSDCLGKERATGDSNGVLDFSFFLPFISLCSKSYQWLILQKSQKCAIFPLSLLTIPAQDQAQELFIVSQKETL